MIPSLLVTFGRCVFGKDARCFGSRYAKWLKRPDWKRQCPIFPCWLRFVSAKFTITGRTNWGGFAVFRKRTFPFSD